MRGEATAQIVLLQQPPKYRSSACSVPGCPLDLGIARHIPDEMHNAHVKLRLALYDSLEAVKATIAKAPSESPCTLRVLQYRCYQVAGEGGEGRYNMRISMRISLYIYIYMYIYIIRISI